MNKDILLDTNVLLHWFFASNKLKKHLPKFEKRALYVSPFSLWEIVIKEQIGKIDIPIPMDQFFNEIFEYFEIIQLKVDDLIAYHRLPLVHRDPFDRILIAQALERSLDFMTTDTQLAGYNLSCICLLK